MSHLRRLLLVPVIQTLGCTLATNPLLLNDSGSESASTSASDEISESTTAGSSSDTDSAESGANTTSTETSSSEDSSGDGTAECGDGVVQASEVCDDGNLVGDDGCENDCTITEILDVGLADNTTCILFEGGHVRCWGENTHGQLGIGHTNHIGDDEMPWTAPFVGIDEPAKQVVTGNAFACALIDGGEHYCWGRNNGRLGYGFTENIGDDELPSLIGTVDAGVEVSALTLGISFGCLLSTANAVKCWGVNEVGQLGYGHVLTLGDNETLSSYGNVMLGEPIQRVDSGIGHNCALTFEGAVLCWGYNGNGELGNGMSGTNISVGDDEIPLGFGPVLPNGVVAVQIVAGNFHSCALTNMGKVICWGSGGSGELGTGTTQGIGWDDTPTLANAADVPDAVELVSGFGHNCIRTEAGELYCWGAAYVGQLGYASIEDVGDDELPIEVGPVDVGGPIDRVWASQNETCARRTTGELYCWGLNSMYRNLGYETTETIGDDEIPASVGPVPLFGR